MEHRLRSAISPRSAWILIGACVLFWVLSAFGLLRLPASVPSPLTFFWLYLNALAALLSAMAVAAAIGALVLHRRNSLRLQSRPSALDAAEETDLYRMLTEEPPPRGTDIPGPGPSADRQPADPARKRFPRRKRRRR